VLDESAHWRLVLNRNQNLIGKCFLVLRRHLEHVPELSPEEWAALHQQLARATQMLNGAMRPDHFNYAFLQNVDRHIHMHIIPRYDEPRTFAGAVFADPDYPAHYSVPAPERRLDPGQHAALAEHLRRFLSGSDGITPLESSSNG
jgi:diadenosine tetraphosphate (Ap4A) HIT family hydrolase